MRPIQVMPYVLLALGVAIVGYGLWRRQQDPPKVISIGSFEYKDKLGTSLVFPKRVVAVAGFETTEVQLPNGTWIDCRGDCAKAIREEHAEIFDAQRERR
jgi:hypothetical protein